MNMKVEVARLFPDAEKVKAVINIVFDNSFVVHGIKIIDSEKGLFVAMPNIKVGEKHKDTFHPIEAAAVKHLKAFRLPLCPDWKSLTYPHSRPLRKMTIWNLAKLEKGKLLSLLLSQTTTAVLIS